MPVIKYITPPPPAVPDNPPLVEGRVYRLESLGWRAGGYFVYHAPKEIIIYLAHPGEPYGGWDEASELDGRIFSEVTLKEV